LWVRTGRKMMPLSMSALPPKADIRRRARACPLCARSGHWLTRSPRRRGRARTAAHRGRVRDCRSNGLRSSDMDSRSSAGRDGYALIRPPALRSSASHQPLIPRDRPLEVVVLLAADEADVFQMREVLLGRGRIAKHQVGFAEMLVGTAMARIEHQ